VPRNALADEHNQVWAVVVARTGNNAKSRLASALSPIERSALALRMLNLVLSACREADLAGTVVVTDTERGAALARSMTPGDAGSRRRPELSGLTGPRCRRPAGARHGGVGLPGDVPLVEPDDLRTIVNAAGDRPRVVVVVPDVAGRGTNALLVRPPHLIEPSFGEPSALRHLAAARRAGEAIRLELPRLALDIDDESRLSMLEGEMLRSH